MSREEILKVLPDIETTVIGVPAGVQDYYPPCTGGELSVLPPGRVERESSGRVRPH